MLIRAEIGTTTFFSTPSSKFPVLSIKTRARILVKNMAKNFYFSEANIPVGVILDQQQETAIDGVVTIVSLLFSTLYSDVKSKEQ